ncbi:Tat pathway signal sequence domain protein [Streptomyces sp. NPDC006872]|uniref:Tat pathway signal sequence domain protein n=1 Tax=Streptomyces sp. NPDC006872 TaxID=3155720 RepID=UPI0033D5EA9F
MVVGAAVPLGAVTRVAATHPAAAASEVCRAPAAGVPMLVTADCDDPRFNQPYVDIDEWRDTPVPHRYVHGGFTGTDARFSFCFPPPKRYRGRFFQMTYPIFTSENAAPDDIGFGVASGAYVVQTNMGGAEATGPGGGGASAQKDPSIGGYRVNAAAAKFSRLEAARMYGKHRCYGYLYGGSGGAYQTISAMENTTGVWDGGVPLVMGSPNAIPSMFTVRVHALRVLRTRNKLPGILDAVDPGGSGDPYADLNEEERGALREATRLGFPPLGWWNHATLTGGALSLVAGSVPTSDPTYVDDFWTKPGYLGTDPTSSVSAARIRHDTTVISVIAGTPGRLLLSSVPTGSPEGLDLVVMSGAATGRRLSLGAVVGNMVVFGYGADPAVVSAIQAGDRVRIDNSWYLALQTYHRHQVPTPDMYGWNQFRGPDGTPVYPQRDVLVGPSAAFNAGGSHQTGRFHGKVIVLESLTDIDAFPWQADWYRTKAQQALGRPLDDNFRLWYTDHAQHTAPDSAAGEARIVGYQGVLQQALRDLSAWVEKGVRPPASTSYKVVDAQVKVAKTAGRRKGIQPVVTLTVNGGEHAGVAVDQPVEFSATVQVPPNAGKVVGAEWDFEGIGTYPVPAQLGRIGSTVTLHATHSFPIPGTYFPVLRATSQREGDPRTPYARIQNLDRVRVVVT